VAGLYSNNGEISCAVRHACDFNPVFHRAVKDDVVYNGKISQPGCQFLAFSPGVYFSGIAFNCQSIGNIGSTYVNVLEIPPVVSPQTVVRASIAAVTINKWHEMCV
jgi:hypothetical protein